MAIKNTRRCGGYWCSDRLAQVRMPSRASAGRSRPSMAFAALGLLPVALGLLPGVSASDGRR
jgi:hypothetical protein